MQHRLTIGTFAWIHAQIIHQAEKRIDSLQFRIDFLEGRLRIRRKEMHTPYNGGKMEQQLVELEEKIISLEKLKTREYSLMDAFEQ